MSEVEILKLLCHAIAYACSKAKRPLGEPCLTVIQRVFAGKECASGRRFFHPKPSVELGYNGKENGNYRDSIGVL